MGAAIVSRSPGQHARELVESQGGEVGVGAGEHRVGEDPVVDGIEGGGGEPVGRGIRRRHREGVVVRDADLGAARGADRGHSLSVRQQLVVRGRQRARHERAPGREGAQRVALQRRHRRLVQRDPARHAVAQPPEHQLDVLGEPRGGVAGEPSALVFERLRQVPVEEGGQRPDALGEQRVDDTFVVIESGRVRGAGAARLHPGPRDREPVVGDPELGEQGDVVAVATVAVGRDVGRRPVDDPSGRVRERVPDRRAAPVGIGRPLDLERRGGSAPAEPRREGGQVGEWAGHRNLAVDRTRRARPPSACSAEWVSRPTRSR